MLRKRRSSSRDISVLGILLTSLLTVDVCQVCASEPTMTSDMAGTRIAWQHAFQSGPDSKVKPIAPLPGRSANGRAIIREVVDPEPIESANTSASLDARMRGLQKSLGEIEFVNSNANEKTPTNQANIAQFAETPILVTTYANPVKAPNRYPIAALHNPLYFQDIGLERCGHTFGCAQTAVSTVKFLAHTVILPYQIVDRPWCTVECDRIDCQNRSPVPDTARALSSCDGLGFGDDVRKAD